MTRTWLGDHAPLKGGSGRGGVRHPLPGREEAAEPGGAGVRGDDEELTERGRSLSSPIAPTKTFYGQGSVQGCVCLFL